MRSIEEIALRKSLLSQRIAAQRDRLGRDTAELQPLIKVADKGIAAARVLRANLPWLGLGLGLVFMLRPSRRRTPVVKTTTMAALTLLWLRRSLTAWRTWRWARQAISIYKESR
jgi:hypothetical protein